MLEIVVFSLIIIGVGGLLLTRRKKRRPGRRGSEFICPVCNEKDCHCERRS